MKKDDYYVEQNTHYIKMSYTEGSRNNQGIYYLKHSNNNKKITYIEGNCNIRRVDLLSQRQMKKPQGRSDVEKM